MRQHVPFFPWVSKKSTNALTPLGRPDTEESLLTSVSFVPPSPALRHLEENSGRRHFLLSSFSALGSMLVGSMLWAKKPLRFAIQKSQKILKLHNIHTGENLVIQASEPLITNPDADLLRRFSHFMRDHRTDQTMAIDPKLLLTVWRLKKIVGGDTVEVISGFRSEATNKKLSEISSGVSKKSYHTKGMAVDLRITNVPLLRLRAAARSCVQGGIGYYPKSNFLHIDVRGKQANW